MILVTIQGNIRIEIDVIYTEKEDTVGRVYIFMTNITVRVI